MEKAFVDKTIDELYYKDKKIINHLISTWEENQWI